MPKSFNPALLLGVLLFLSVAGIAEGAHQAGLLAEGWTQLDPFGAYTRAGEAIGIVGGTLWFCLAIVIIFWSSAEGKLYRKEANWLG